MNSHEVFIHIHQGCFAGTGAIVRLPQCQWSKPDGYGKISQCITKTKHSKAKTVCIFLGIYCNGRHWPAVKAAKGAVGGFRKKTVRIPTGHVYPQSIAVYPKSNASYTSPNIYLKHKLRQNPHNTPVPYATMHHFVTDMCTFLLQNGVLLHMGLVHCGICVQAMSHTYPTDSTTTTKLGLWSSLSTMSLASLLTIPSSWDVIQSSNLSSWIN